LGAVVGRGTEQLAQLVLLFVLGEGDTGRRANIHAGVAFDALLIVENGLYVAIQTALCLFVPL
jgi:hypothetical protein